MRFDATVRAVPQKKTGSHGSAHRFLPTMRRVMVGSAARRRERMALPDGRLRVWTLE